MRERTGDRIDRAIWRDLERAHAERVDRATATYRRCRAEAKDHPVEDFLFRYYSYTPAQLRRWHPGTEVLLEQAAGRSRASWRHYRIVGSGVVLDTPGFLAARERTVRFVRELVGATLARPASLGCFGMHEWAMVYRLPADDVRHRRWPLRLGSAGTDEVVAAHGIRCSHFDAHRFFTEDAAPRNTLSPRRDGQVSLEQPGCLHAAMDVYKWAFKLTPLVPSELTIDAFDLAREVRAVDMRASPYDLSALGYAPIAIETAEGKAEYRCRQSEFADRSNALRRRLLAVLDAATSAGPAS